MSRSMRVASRVTGGTPFKMAMVTSHPARTPGDSGGMTRSSITPLALSTALWSSPVPRASGRWVTRMGTPH